MLLENYLLLIMARNFLKDEDYDGLPRNENFIDRIMMLNKRYLDDKEIQDKLESVKLGHGIFDNFSVTRGSQSTDDVHGFKTHEIIEVQSKGEAKPNKVLFTYLFPDDEDVPNQRNESRLSNSESKRKYSINKDDNLYGNTFAIRPSQPRFFDSTNRLATKDVRISRTPRRSSAHTKDRIFQLFA